jgi:hypothetical protein
METEAFALLLKGDVRRAWSRIARHQTAQMFPDSAWTRGVPSRCSSKQVISSGSATTTCRWTQRKAAGAHLAMSVLMGEFFADAGRHLASFTDGLFDWSQALAFSRPSPCGKETLSGTESLPELYAMTRIKEALAACEPNSLKSDRLGKGIRILPVHCSDSSICNGGKYQYEWSEIEALPRRMGCQCSYAAWL